MTLKKARYKDPSLREEIVIKTRPRDGPDGLEFIRKQLQNAQINILEGLVEKVDSICEQMENFNRKLETFSQNQRKKC